MVEADAAGAAPEPFLRITEIFHSVQGESTWAGLPCTFVRLTGCPLRCVWCDTAYAFSGGERMTLDAIVAAVERVGTPLVEVTATPSVDTYSGTRLASRSSWPTLPRSPSPAQQAAQTRTNISAESGVVAAIRSSSFHACSWVRCLWNDWFARARDTHVGHSTAPGIRPAPHTGHFKATMTLESLGRERVGATSGSSGRGSR